MFPRRIAAGLSESDLEVAKTQHARADWLASGRTAEASDGRRVAVAYHRLSATFPIGTLKGMIADAGWTDDDLRRIGLLK